MSILEQQQQTLNQKAYIDILRRGLQPLIARVQDLARQMQGKKKLSTPFFEHIDIEEDSLSDPVQWNGKLEEIAFDLKTAFDEAKSQVQRLMALSTGYRHERDKIARRIKELHNRCDVLEQQLNNPGYRGFTDSFTDFDVIETIGSTSRGLPKTTAIVDLKRGSVHLSRSFGLPAKYDLKGAYIKVDSSGDIEQYGKIENIISDSTNETWQAVVTGENEASITVTLEPKGSVMVNCIELEFENSSDSTVEISIGNITPIGFGDYLCWEFEPQEIGFLVLTVKKTLPAEPGKFTFSLRHLALKYEHYQNKGILVTKTFPINALDKIQLIADENVPPQTDIRYYLSLEYDNKPFEWKEVDKDLSLSFNNMQESFGLFDRGEPIFGTIAAIVLGINYYAIGELSNKPLDMKLYIGERMWALDAIPRPNYEEWQPTLSDWINQRPQKSKVIDTARSVIILQEDKLYRFSTYIYCQQDTPVMKVNSVIDKDGKLALYVNSNHIKLVSGTYSFTLNKGWNKIEYLLATYTPNTEFRPGLTLNYLGTVYASNQSMQEVSLHDLTCNIAPDDRTKYALIKQGDKFLVAINYDPVAIDFFRQGCRYYYNYNHLNEIEGLKGFRFMAVLDRMVRSKEVTPHLLGYKLLAR